MRTAHRELTKQIVVLQHSSAQRRPQVKVTQNLVNRDRLCALLCCTATSCVDASSAAHRLCVRHSEA